MNREAVIDQLKATQELGPDGTKPIRQQRSRGARAPQAKYSRNGENETSFRSRIHGFLSGGGTALDLLAALS
jgi:hypothetical protein